MGSSSQYHHNSLDPLSQSQSKDDCHHSGRHSSSKNSTSKKTDDKKSQAQRLLEFEMWTNEKTLKELEYSQRRSKKKQRRREQRKFARHRVWKKLYLPGVLAMTVGTFLTLAATLQSLGEGTYLWDVRGVLIIMGPVLLALGFIVLMLAAACTFKQDQMVKDTPIGPPSEFLLLGLDLKNDFQDTHTYLNHGRSSSRGMTKRSLSVDTTDMPLPEDLDPNRHFMDNGPHRSCRSNRGSSFRSLRSHCSAGSHQHCHHSTDYGDQDGYTTGQYNSTASWVRSVSASHRPQSSALKRQSSDSNLITLSSSSTLLGYHHPDPLPVTVTSSSSHSDLPQQLLASFTSSGYQSASNSLKGSSPIDVQHHQHHHHHHHKHHHPKPQQEGGHHYTNTSLCFTTTTSASTAASSKPSQSLSSPSSSKGNNSANITIVKEGRSNRPPHQHVTHDVPSVHQKHPPKLSDSQKSRGPEHAQTSPKSVPMTNELPVQSHMEVAPADHNQNNLRQNFFTLVAPDTTEKSKISTENGFLLSSLGNGKIKIPTNNGYLVNGNTFHASLPRTDEDSVLMQTARVHKKTTANKDISTVKQSLTDATTIKQTDSKISQNGPGTTIVDIESHTVNECDSDVTQKETAVWQNGNAAIAPNFTTTAQDGSSGHSPGTITSTSPVTNSTVRASSSEQSGGVCRVVREAKCGQQQADDTSNVIHLQRHKRCIATKTLCTDI